MKKIILFITLFLSLINFSYAVCPVCTVAVGAGLGFLRVWGVDDLITGLWFGALIVSSIAWFIDWLNRKNVHFLFRKILVIASFYIIFIWPLYFLGYMVGAPTIWKIDKLLWGVLLGTFIFIVSIFSDKYLRKINNNRIMIIYQKVIIPIVFLIITSTVVYLLIKIFA